METLLGIFAVKQPQRQPVKQQVRLQHHELNHEVSAALRLNTQVAHQYRTIATKNQELELALQAQSENCRSFGERVAELEDILRAQNVEAEGSAQLVRKLQEDIQAHKAAALNSAAMMMDLMASVTALEHKIFSMDAVHLAEELATRGEVVQTLTLALQQQEQRAAQEAEEQRRLREQLREAHEAAAQESAQQEARYATLAEQVTALQRRRDALEQEACERERAAREQQERHEQERRQAEAKLADLTAQAATLRQKLAESQRAVEAAREDCESAKRDCKTAQLDSAIWKKKKEDLTAGKVAVEEERDRHRYWLDVLCSPHLDVGFAREHQPAVDAAMAALEQQLAAAHVAVEVARETAREQLAAHRVKSRRLLDAQQARLRELEARLAEAEVQGFGQGAESSGDVSGKGDVAGAAGAWEEPASLVVLRPCVAAADAGSRCSSEGGASSAACSGAPSECLSSESSTTSLGSMWEAGVPSDEVVSTEDAHAVDSSPHC